MAYKMKNASAAGNMYFTSNYGVMRLTNPNSLYQPAGIIQPIECDVRLVAAGAGIVMEVNDSYAYRVVIGYIDENNNTVLSPPSNRVILAATAANTYKIVVTVRINGNPATTWFYRVYRSKKKQVHHLRILILEMNCILIIKIYLLMLICLLGWFRLMIFMLTRFWVNLFTQIQAEKHLLMLIFPSLLSCINIL